MNGNARIKPKKHPKRPKLNFTSTELNTAIEAHGVKDKDGLKDFYTFNRRIEIAKKFADFLTNQPKESFGKWVLKNSGREDFEMSSCAKQPQKHEEFMMQVNRIIDEYASVTPPLNIKHPQAIKMAVLYYAKNNRVQPDIPDVVNEKIEAETIPVQKVEQCNPTTNPPVVTSTTLEVVNNMASQGLIESMEETVTSRKVVFKKPNLGDTNE